MVNQKFDLVNYSTTNTIKLVSRRIKRFVELNDKIPNSNSTLTYFHSKHVAPISIESYLNRILKYTLCGNECFLSVLVYFHRMSQIQNYIPSFPSSCKKNKKPFIINSYNIHRLLIAGVTVSAKFNSDIFFLNSHYAKVGGLPINELNSLEMEFLMLNNYDLHVSVEELQYTGDCLLNNTLPEPVIVNGIKRMELLAQPVFFNKTINKFALTYEDTILIEKKIRDEERKYGRASRFIKKSLYERSKNGESELERDKSNSYRPLKYSKSYDLMKSSKGDQLEETYRYGNGNALPYQPPNSLPYVTNKSNSKRSDYSSHTSHRNSKKSSVHSNPKLNYRHSTNSMNLSQYQDKLDLQSQLINTSHHESMLFMSNNLPYTTDTSKKSSTDKYDMIKMARKGSQDIDENSLKAKFKSFMDPENKLNSKETEQYQKAYNAYKDMYYKEMMHKNKNNSSQVQVDGMNSDNITATASNSNGSSSKKYSSLKKSLKERSRRKSKTKEKINDNSSFNSSSSSSFLDDEVDQSFYHPKEESNYNISPTQHLHPSQPNNHRVSHLDLNQARKNYSRQQSNLSVIPAENRNSIRNSYTDDSLEFSSPKPNNSYKNARRINGNKNPKNGEYQLKTYYNGDYQPENSVLTNEDESFNYNASYDKNEIIDQRRPVKDRKNAKEKVHKRLSRNLNRILNNFNVDYIKSDSDKEKEKDLEKAKENEKDKENVMNTARVRKGVKLMERKIKGLSLSHLLKQNKENDNSPNLKERHSFSVLSLSHAERQKLNFLTNPEFGFNNTVDMGSNVEELKRKHSTSKSKPHVHKSKDKQKEKDKNKEKIHKKSTSSLKKLRDEMSLENSRKYYETLTNILKRNKENSKKDYSTYLNDIDIKVTSNSNDTINQITEIYHSYTENSNQNSSPNQKSKSISKSKSQSKSNSTVTSKSNEKENGSPLSPNNKMNISGTTFGYNKENEHSVLATERNKMGEAPKPNRQSDIETTTSNNLGEFDDVHEHTSSFYHDLNEEKKNFNQNIYDFNKYYHNRYDTDESNGLEGSENEMDNSANIMNNFDLNVIDEKNKEEHNDGAYDFIKKNHSYTSTDIYSYYANLHNSKNEDKSKFNNNMEENDIELKELNHKEQNKGKEEDEDDSYNFITKEDDQNISILKNYYKTNYDQNEMESSMIMPSKSELIQQQKRNSKNVNKDVGRTTQKYENEIPNVKNYSEQNEIINVDYTKLSDEEGEGTNLSSFATSVPSIYISSSIRDDKSVTSSPAEDYELEEEKIILSSKEDDPKMTLREVIPKKEGKTFSDYYNTRRLNDSYSTDEEEKVKKTKLKEKEKTYHSHTEEITEVPTDVKNYTHFDQPSEEKYYLTTEDENENIKTEHEKEINESNYFPNIKFMKNQPNFTSKTTFSTASSSSSSYNPSHANQDVRESYISSNFDNKSKTFIDEKKSPTDSEKKIRNMSNLNNIIKNDKNVNLRYFRSSSDPALCYKNNDHCHSIDRDNIAKNMLTSDSLPASPLTSNNNLDHDYDHDHDRSHQYVHDSYANFAKKGGSNTINYSAVDFNNPLSYVSYPNYPIQYRHGDVGHNNHRESFQNLLKQFQKNCKNDNTAISDLHKKYGPRHSHSTINSDTSKNGNNGNITFNEILERFKKNCDVADKNQINGKQPNVSSHASSTTLATINTIPYTSSTTTDTTTIPNNETTTTTTASSN
jgi:hypothetical protein